MTIYWQNVNQKPKEVGQLVTEFTTDGRIVSVFDRAVNILISHKIIISIVARTRQMTALSILYPSLFNYFQSGHTKITKDTRVKLKPDLLTIGQLRIDLKTTRRFQGHAAQDLSNRLDAGKVLSLGRALETAGRQGGMLGVINGKSGNDFFVQKAIRVCNRMWNLSGSCFAENLSELVGLGIGLTPSGDDMLCGFLLGDYIFTESHSHQREKHFPLLDDAQKQIIWQSASRTNDAGRTLLWMALKGRFPNFLLKAVKDLANSTEPTAVLKAVIVTADCGRTSGTDALVGLWLYMQWYHSMPIAKTSADLAEVNQ
jgi:hypothetical protein